MIYLILLVAILALIVYLKRMASQQIPMLKTWAYTYKKHLIIGAIVIGLICWKNITILT